MPLVIAIIFTLFVLRMLDLRAESRMPSARNINSVPQAIPLDDRSW